MRPFFRILIILSVILGLAIVLQQFKRPNPVQTKIQKFPEETAEPYTLKWDERTLQIRRKLAFEAQIPEKYITGNDVEFAQEFPSFQFVKTPIFTILAEKKSFAFQNAFQTLTQFEKQFQQFFLPLSASKKVSGLQVLFFDTEETFGKIRSKLKIPEWTAGFYSIIDDRLFLYNAMDVSKSKSAINYMRIPFRYQELILPTLTGQMDQVMTVMRHEATHQLLIHYNIVPMDAAAWLHEGLATFCEKPQIGLPHRQYMTLMRHIPIIPIHQLMQYKSFLNLGEDQALFAYTTSWAFIYYLMQPQRKNGFFKYLSEVSQNSAASSDTHLLAQKLGLKPEELEKDFQDFTQQMRRQ